MKKSIEENDALVAAHYESNVIDYEKIRLEQDSPVEFAITLQVLNKWIPKNSTILDVGVGVGHYASHLAQQGCHLHLVDICESFLKLTKEKLAGLDLTPSILSSTRASASNLDFFEDESVDYVLMLGPFYHITDYNQRIKAVKEACRVLKKGGLLFAAGINRLAILRELFQSERFFGDKQVNIKNFHHQLEQYCQTGVSDSSLFPPLGNAYCATVEEFQHLFSSFFTQVDFLGLESFTGFNQKKYFDRSPDELSLWLSIIEKTARTIEGTAASEHFLYVGRKI